MWRVAALLLWLCGALWGSRASGSEPSSAPQTAPPGATAQNDRLLLSASATELTGARGGGDGQVLWLHELTGRMTRLAAGVEYQSIADASWVVGSLGGVLSCDPPAASQRLCSLYGELHEGQGRTGTKPFHYAIAAAGMGWTVGPRLTVQLEDRYIDIDRSLGHLPKLSLAFLQGGRSLTTLSYAHSAAGNLATGLLTARIDCYRRDWRYLGGAARGSAAPAVVNLQSSLVTAGHTLNEGFFGVAKAFRGGELQALGDYLDLGGGKRLSLTLSYALNLRP